MTRFEYKVMAAPTRAPKVRGADSVESRFAVALAGVLNREGMDGWEYLRAETLPVGNAPASPAPGPASAPC